MPEIEPGSLRRVVGAFNRRAIHLSSSPDLHPLSCAALEAASIRIMKNFAMSGYGIILVLSVFGALRWGRPRIVRGRKEIMWAKGLLGEASLN